MVKARVVSVGKDHNDISRLLDHLGHLHPALLQLLRPNHGSLVPQEVGAIQSLVREQVTSQLVHLVPRLGRDAIPAISQ